MAVSSSCLCGLVFVSLVLSSFIVGVSTFNVGVKGTTCGVDNDPCESLYNAECDVEKRHCKCPSGTYEDKGLKRCKVGKKPSGGGGDLFGDLPFEYEPGDKAPAKPSKPKEPVPAPEPAHPPPVRPTPAPRGPAPPPQKPVAQDNSAAIGGGVGGGLGVALIGLVVLMLGKTEFGKSLLSKFGGGGSQSQQQQQSQAAPYQMSDTEAQIQPNA